MICVFNFIRAFLMLYESLCRISKASEGMYQFSFYILFIKSCEYQRISIYNETYILYASNAVRHKDAEAGTHATSACMSCRFLHIYARP